MITTLTLPATAAATDIITQTSHSTSQAESSASYQLNQQHAMVTAIVMVLVLVYGAGVRDADDETAALFPPLIQPKLHIGAPTRFKCKAIGTTTHCKHHQYQ
uniref:Uncharacterized protein n=1 Tax=Eutreptiella gymnastica TaxID=73025 RepID=A0A7S4G112_9EUGL